MLFGLNTIKTMGSGDTRKINVLYLKIIWLFSEILVKKFIYVKIVTF
jgi:hypothetical protein